MAIVATKCPYLLESQPIGRGAYSLVFRGKHRETGQVAAVKKPKKRDAEALARFEREVEAQSNLDHPSVMPLLDFSLEGRWLAMPEAIRNLTTAIEDDRDVNNLQLVPVIRSAAEALGYANREGYVHRDVSPNNMFELSPGRWVMGDWGLVRDASRESSRRMTTRRRPIGTAGFIAPEARADPHSADEACDVYSLGRVAHFASTGTWPVDSFPLPTPPWPWTDFVARTTAPRDERDQSFSTVLEMLSTTTAAIRRMENESEALAPCPRCQTPIWGARCEFCGLVWD